MHKLEALRILEVKLAAIEQEHRAELAAREGAREQIDAKAEARMLAAVFDFLRDCKYRTQLHYFAFLNGTCALSRTPIH
jgi:hypothetical protein